jgi:hypothetical protein
VGRGTEDAVWVEARGKTRGVRGGPQNEWFVEVCGSLVARTGVDWNGGNLGYMNDKGVLSRTKLALLMLRK